MHIKKTGRITELVLLLAFVISANVIAFEPDYPPLFVTPSMTASARVPIAEASSFWSDFTTGGFFLTVPSTISGMSCAMGIEVGKMGNKDNTLYLQCIALRGGVLFDSAIVYKKFRLVPFAGLSSFMAGASDNGRIDILQPHVFGKVENEYGVYAGIEPVLTVRKMEFSLPVSLEQVFSSPERFTSVVFSFKVGYRFEK